MKQTLQAKFQLLGLAFTVLVLLMAPMATQLKHDTRDSIKEASNTVLGKVIREMTRKSNVQPDLSEVQVEDYWAQEQQRLKEADPACTDACEADGDYDGDGVTNKDEVRNGTDPSCNEKTENCDDYTPGNTTLPDEPIEKRRVDLLLDETFEADQCMNLFAGCSPIRIVLNPGYDEMILYLNVTGYTGLNWAFELRDPENNQIWFEQDSNAQAQSVNYPTKTHTVLEPQVGEPGYSAELDLSATSGQWHVQVYGVAGS